MMLVNPLNELYNYQLQLMSKKKLKKVLETLKSITIYWSLVYKMKNLTKKNSIKKRQLLATFYRILNVFFYKKKNLLILKR